MEEILEDMQVKIAEEKAEYLKKEVEKRQELSEIVKAETEALKHQITEENLEKSIMEALENPLDYEYAIDLEGHIYRGRNTRSILVPEAEREKIPVPVNEYDFLHKEQKS